MSAQPAYLYVCCLLSNAKYFHKQTVDFGTLVDSFILHFKGLVPIHAYDEVYRVTATGTATILLAFPTPWSLEVHKPESMPLIKSEVAVTKFVTTYAG